jgi:hypothetical protein
LPFYGRITEEGLAVAVHGEPQLEQEYVTRAAMQMFRLRAEQFREMAAMAVTKNVAAMLATTSRKYSEQAAFLEAKLTTARNIE